MSIKEGFVRIEKGGTALLAGAAISEGDLVYIDTSTTPDSVKPTSGPTDAPFGTAFDDYAVGDEVAAKPVGVANLHASEAIDPGDKIVPAADGQAQADDGTSGHVVCGIAKTHAAAADAEFEAYIEAVKVANA